LNSSFSKVAYKPVGVLLGIGAGMLSGILFKQLWKLASGEHEAPSATDEERSWGEVLAAAALQGAVFAAVKAAVDRAGATGMRRLTGRWPD
jgi:hypothetical protein